MTLNNITHKVDKLHADLVTEMNNIVQFSSLNDNFPKVSSTFESVKNLIEHPSYNIVVCGEVKKGKSSLLNAIVGQEILPVNNEIATSQVFRISNNSQESFALVFTDGTRKSINRDELSLYGSQVDATLETQELFRAHTLSYIEVNVPVAFLPNGVNLIDTPGLGALYKSHEWITQNYVKKASAVIFVMDPERPLVEKEKEFILKVLDITPNILFVMTKIDMFNDKVCEDIIARNEELLALIFANKGLKAPHIYPVSSKSLMNAAVETDEDFREEDLQNSRFPELKEQLLLLAYKSIGLTHSGIAIQEMSNYFANVKSIIEDMLKVTSPNNNQELHRINAQKQELQNRLLKEGGVNSPKWNETRDNIIAICNSVTSRVQQLVSTGGPTFKHYEQLIDSVNNRNDLEKLKSTLENCLSSDIDQQWSSIMEEAREKINAELYQYHLSLDLCGSGASYNGIVVEELNLKDAKIQDFLPSIQRAFWVALVLANIIGGLFGPLTATLVNVAFAGLAFRLFWTDERKRRFKQALVLAFNQISIEMLHVKADAKRSLVGEFSYNLRKSAENVMINNFKEKQNQIKQEIANLEAQASQKEKLLQQKPLWKHLSQEWNVEAKRINNVIDLRKEVVSSLNV